MKNMYLLNSLFLIAAAHFSFNYCFKEQYYYFLYNMSYIILYNYGKVEIIMKEYYENTMKNYYVAKICDFISYYSANFERDNNDADTELIISNNIFAKVKMSYLLDNYDNNTLKYMQDLVIYTEKNDKEEKSNKVIIYDVSDLTNIIVSPKKCNYQFLSLNIQLKCPEGKNFDLELDCKRETYYVVNNRLNALFFSYLLKNKYGITSNVFTLQYDILMIDHNANLVVLTEKDEIILFKDYYQIIPYNYEEIQVKKENNYNRVLLTLKNLENLDLNESNDNFEKEQDDNLSDASYEKLEQ
jgi:hypothetical protein